MKKKIINFPSYNVSASESIEIVKNRLYDDSISFQSKILAIQNVSDMPTHNSVTKKELIECIRWIFEHYDFLD